MSFWSLKTEGSRVALLAASGETLTYAQLARLADELATRLPASPPRTLGFLLFPANFDSIALYLGALRSGRHVPLLLPPGIHPASLNDLIARYQPDWIATGAGPETARPVGYGQVYQAHNIAVHVRQERTNGIVPREPLGLLL